MTLHIIHSNKVERLHDELCYLLSNKPLPNPFEAETIVCPSQAMAKWINIRFTQKMGIAANYDYPMPSSWIWQCASNLLPNVPDNDPLQRDLMAWRVFHLLENETEDDCFSVLNKYLLNDADSTKRWSLAKRIASVFERYQHFRPDLIQQWNEGKGDDWQSKLWRTLTQNLETDRVQLLINLGQFLTNTKNVSSLPKRITFFSVSALPPLIFKNIQALAQHIDIFFFVLSPSEHYWSDFITLKQQARLRLKSPELNDYYTTGHELLASWGRQGQVFQDMLLHELDDAITEQFDVYDSEFSPSILNQLQRSFYDLDDDAKTIEIDDSLRINQCHSPLRECEVLHDQCLSLLQNDEITPEDILVIVPNMEQYAVSIESVFKRSDDQKSVKPFIPWNLSDSTLQVENPLINAFLTACSLPNSRFTATEMLSFLDCPLLLKQFHLEESDQSIIRDYIRKAHINWGFDAEHKAGFNVPNTLNNTWHEAQKRFFTSYSIDETALFQDTAPLSGFSSSRAVVIAHFMHLLDTLNRWREQLTYERSVQQWQQSLNDLIDTLFGLSDDNGLQLIRDAIDELVTQSAPVNLPKQPKINRALVQQWLLDYFQNNQSNQRFFSGGITFCGMRPMRSVPFKVIVMLGMNEHEFPRHNKPIEFDLMASQWQPGDLLISDEDRYLFLEAILCARHTLIISYCASSLKDNSAKEPSLLVSELCEFIDVYFTPNKTNAQALSDQMTTRYAMHSFSAQNYSAHYQSYNHYWADVAKQLLSNDKSSNDKPSAGAAIAPVYEDALESIEIKQLISCMRDPLAFYFKFKLNIRLYEEAEFNDDEPFSLDALQKWSLKDQLIKDHLDHQETSLTSIQALSVLPHGAQAKASFDAIEEELEEQLIGLEEYLKQSPEAKNIELTISNGVSLKGQVNHYYQGLGLLTITPSNFSSKPFIECWLNHCLLSASQQLAATEQSVLRFKDKMITFKVLGINEATSYLQEAVELMQQAMHSPLTLLPKSSFVYQYQLFVNDETKAFSEALLKWHGNPQNDASMGEKENQLVALTFQQFMDDPSVLLGSDDFKLFAHKFYATALKSSHFEDAQ